MTQRDGATRRDSLTANQPGPGPSVGPAARRSRPGKRNFCIAKTRPDFLRTSGAEWWQPASARVPRAGAHHDRPARRRPPPRRRRARAGGAGRRAAPRTDRRARRHPLGGRRRGARRARRLRAASRRGAAVRRADLLHLGAPEPAPRRGGAAAPRSPRRRCRPGPRRGGLRRPHRPTPRRGLPAAAAPAGGLGRGAPPGAAPRSPLLAGQASGLFAGPQPRRDRDPAGGAPLLRRRRPRPPRPAAPPLLRRRCRARSRSSSRPRCWRRSTRPPVVPSAANPTPVGVRAGLPDAQGRAALAWRVGEGHGLVLGVSGHTGRQRYRLDGLVGQPDGGVDGWGGAVDSWWRGSGWRSGRRLGRAATSARSAPACRAPPSGPTPAAGRLLAVSGVGVQGGWAQLRWRALPVLTVVAGGGQESAESRRAGGRRLPLEERPALRRPHRRAGRRLARRPRGDRLLDPDHRRDKEPRQLHPGGARPAGRLLIGGLDCWLRGREMETRSSPCCGASLARSGHHHPLLAVGCRWPLSFVLGWQLTRRPRAIGDDRGLTNSAWRWRAGWRPTSARTSTRCGRWPARSRTAAASTARPWTRPAPPQSTTSTRGSTPWSRWTPPGPPSPATPG